MDDPAREFCYFLLKDPHWAYLSWRLPPATLAAARRRLPLRGEPSLRLRIHDVTDVLFDGGNSHHCYDVAAVAPEGEWYWSVPSPERVYCGELVLAADDGRCEVVLRSRPLAVPRDRPGAEGGERWSTFGQGSRATATEGFLMIVLHTHMPFVRDPEVEYPLEEDWLYEAISESYTPLIERFERLADDGLDFRLTVSVTPCLAAMLADPLVAQRYLRYLDDRARLAAAEERRARPGGYPPPALARACRERFEACRERFAEAWSKDLPARLRRLEEEGRIDLLSSAATHAYLPLAELYPETVELQAEVGLRHHERLFGRRPRGFWLPECGFFPGLDGLLGRCGVDYLFLESHGLLNGRPAPRLGVYAPVHCPSGIAAFGRDWESHDQVWLKDKGYPGEPAYLDVARDLVHEGRQEEVRSLLPYDGARTGIRYRRNDGGPYDPAAARERWQAHADHFVAACHERVRSLAPALGRKPLIVAMFDTEHFGHWWHEGPDWLDRVVRGLSREQSRVRLVTAGDYLAAYPTNQVVEPAASSWGYQGYSEPWLMGRNAWIYPQLYAAVDRLNRLMDALAVPADPPQPVREALGQYLRELMLAQTSDWAFILHAETATSYAESRVRGHLDAMRSIAAAIASGDLDPRWLTRLREKHNLFRELDLFALYRDLRAGHAHRPEPGDGG
jgi:1,4-alpha-glucan branching enzyme